MCGRFTLTWNEWRQVAGALGIEDEGDAAASFRPRFNIAPTDQHFSVTSAFERRKAQRARWGLVNRWARARTITTPANASTPGLRRSNSCQPYAKRFSSAVASFLPMAFSNGPVLRASGRRSGFTPRAGGLLLFAGLYEFWYPVKDRPELTFTIVTCAVDAAIAGIHDRMPGGARRARSGRLDEPARARPGITETTARAGTAR